MNLSDRKNEFLALQRGHKTTSAACGTSSFARSTVQRWRKDDRKFRQLHDAALAGQPTEAPDCEPVSITDFVCDPRYLGKSAEVRRVVMDALREFYSGDFHTAVFGGAIGVGKTYGLQLIFLYELYRLSCMADPHAEFGLDRDSKIIFAIQNRTEKLAQDNDFATIREMIAKSKYFQRCFPPIKKPTKDRIEFPNNIAIWAESGDFRAILGMNAFVSFMDEMNFMAISSDSVKATDGGFYDQAREMYNVARSRQQSRFYLNGQQRSKILLASSAHYRGAFTDVIESEARSDSGIFVWKRAIWQARPEHYSAETFAVFIGDQSRDPFILKDSDAIDPVDRHLIVHAPTDFLPNARRDIYKFLMDDAGIAVQPATSFITDRDQLAKAFRIDSILSRPSIISGEPVQLVRDNVVNPKTVRFAHLDLSKTKDGTGIAIGHIHAFGEFDRGGMIEMHPLIVIDCVLQIKPPRHGEIDYARIRALLYHLRKFINLTRVTADQALSADLLQQMAMQGFQVGLQSVDRSTEPYQLLKDAIADGRIALPMHEVLLRELGDLQIDWKRGKVDHRPNGSKDCADAVAGVVFGLSHDKRLRIEAGQLDRLMPRLGSVISPVYLRGNELDQYSASNDPFVRAMNAIN